MKQRVAIARALAMQPRVLLMDEPFAALDALTRRKMQEELLALWDEVRFTLLFVTHSIEEALVVGNRILLLSPASGPRARRDQQPQFTQDVRQRTSSRRRRSASTGCCSRNRNPHDEHASQPSARAYPARAARARRIRACRCNRSASRRRGAAAARERIVDAELAAQEG